MTLVTRHSSLVTAALLAACASAPATVPPGTTWRAMVAWTEVTDPHSACREFLRETGNARSIADGCSGWRNGEFHIITRVVRHERDFYTVGHELAHGKLGHFHDNAGNWVITR